MYLWNGHTYVLKHAQDTGLQDALCMRHPSISALISQHEPTLPFIALLAPIYFLPETTVPLSQLKDCAIM